MSREWKPGDVAVVTGETFAPVKGSRVRTERAWVGSDMCWHFADGAAIHTTRGDLVSEARPLVVIDPEDREQARHLAHVVDVEVDKIPYGHTDYAEELTLAGQRALRSLIEQPKPDEPTGLGAVVEDESGLRWVRAGLGAADWQPVDNTYYSPYREIAAVKVLSEGVTP